MAADVCVAVASCGRPEGVRRCLAALAGGDVAAAEIIVVDQVRAEPDDEVTADAAADAGARYIRQEPLGLSASRNAALQHATRPILAMTDDDCVPDRGWVAAIADAFAASADLAAVTGPVLPLPPDGERVFAVSSRTSEVRRDFHGRVAPWLVGTGGNCAVRREWLRRAGGYDERLGAGSPGRAGEDLDLLDRLLAAGGAIVYEPAAVVRHERQDAARRRATRGSYGHGVGAWLGLRLRERDGFAVPALGRWLALRGRLLVRAASRGQGSELKAELLVLAGTAHGLRYGLAQSPRGRRRQRSVALDGD